MKRMGGALGTGLPLRKFKEKLAADMNKEQLFDWQLPEDYEQKEQHYYKWLKRKVRELDITLNDVCADAEVSIHTLMYWRHGNTSTMTTIFKIERALAMHKLIKDQREQYRSEHNTKNSTDSIKDNQKK